MIEITFLAIAVLLVLSVIASKLSDRFSVPALLVFLFIGMLAGSEGLGGIYFDDPLVAQGVGFFALAVISSKHSHIHVRVLPAGGRRLQEPWVGHLSRPGGKQPKLRGSKSQVRLDYDIFEEPLSQSCGGKPCNPGSYQQSD